jgi:hypothetical protein
MAKTAYLCVQRSPEMRPSMGEVFGLWFFKFSCSEKCLSRNVYELLSVWGFHGNIFTRMLLCFTVKHAVHTVHAPPFSIHTLHVSIIYIYSVSPCISNLSNAFKYFCERFLSRWCAFLKQKVTMPSIWGSDLHVIMQSDKDDNGTHILCSLIFTIYDSVSLVWMFW